VDNFGPNVTFKKMLDASDFDILKGRCLELCNNTIVEVSKDVLFFEAKAISDKGTVSSILFLP
jgi:hypothetical protein